MKVRMRVAQTSFRTWRIYYDHNKFYFVSFDDKGWHCSCSEFVINGKICVHIKLVKNNIKFKEELKK